MVIPFFTALGVTNSQQDVNKERAENKRRYLGWQSVRLKPQESDADLYEIDVNTPTSLSLEGPRSPISDREKPSPSSVSDREEPSRSSITETHTTASKNWPSRKAAEKVQSYKDMPLNIKMRRPN
ncbi:uncharacterized protein LOC141608275 [Silene latifolia]|uniref:uncharacterized protein LOC141608275 n=1 Tax=Silene latifolia TaxID=37657 RepID=UPI003D779929